MKLAEKQKRWKRAESRLAVQTRRSERNQCRDKLRHDNFLSAMLHAQRMTKLSGRLYTPYSCVHCGCDHVGSASEYVIWMFEGVSFRADAST